MRTQTHRCKRTRVHVRTSARMQMHTTISKHNHTCVRAHACTRTHVHARTPAGAQMHTHMHALHACTHDTNRHAYTHAHARIPALVQMHTHALHACTHAHIYTRAYTNGHFDGVGEEEGSCDSDHVCLCACMGFDLFGQA